MCSHLRVIWRCINISHFINPVLRRMREMLIVVQWCGCSSTNIVWVVAKKIVQWMRGFNLQFNVTPKYLRQYVTHHKLYLLIHDSNMTCLFYLMLNSKLHSFRNEFSRRRNHCFSKNDCNNVDFKVKSQLTLFLPIS